MSTVVDKAMYSIVCKSIIIYLQPSTFVPPMNYRLLIVRPNQCSCLSPSITCSSHVIIAPQGTVRPGTRILFVSVNHMFVPCDNRAAKYRSSRYPYLSECNVRPIGLFQLCSRCTLSNCTSRTCGQTVPEDFQFKFRTASSMLPIPSKRSNEVKSCSHTHFQPRV